MNGKGITPWQLAEMDWGSDSSFHWILGKKDKRKEALMKNAARTCSRRRFIRLLALLGVGWVTTGFSNLFEGRALRAVDETPFLDRPARFSFARFIMGGGGNTLSCAIVNFEGQKLRAYSNNLTFEDPTPGTLREILKTVQEPYRYRLFEVRSHRGKTLGYMLAHEGGIASYHLDILAEEGSLFLMGAEPTVD